jgi:hypothetical protein
VLHRAEMPLGGSDETGLRLSGTKIRPNLRRPSRFGSSDGSPGENPGRLAECWCDASPHQAGPQNTTAVRRIKVQVAEWPIVAAIHNIWSAVGQQLLVDRPEERRVEDLGLGAHLVGDPRGGPEGGSRGSPSDSGPDDGGPFRR